MQADVTQAIESCQLGGSGRIRGMRLVLNLDPAGQRSPNPQWLMNSQ